MRNVLVLKATQHVDDGVRLTDVPKELITQAFTLRGTFHQTSDIDYFTSGRNDASWMYNLCELGKALIRNGNHTDIGFNRTKREISCLCLST